MFEIVNTIDNALESKGYCKLVDKTGRYLHGQVVDSWVRVSGGKMRGKIRFDSKERGEVEVDANDILTLELVDKE